jgi:anti-sigma regulatory factor (Ser/Thr protein kinase)
MDDIKKQKATELKEAVKISITFPTNAYFMSGIRDFTFSLIKNMTTFSEQWAYRFQSIVDELCNNAVEHGSAPGAEVRITFIYTPNLGLDIYVDDSGTGTGKKAEDMKEFVTERLDPSFVSGDLRGRGLAKIVAQWTDTLEFSDFPQGGLRVHVRKLLKTATDASQITVDSTSNNPTRIMLPV